MPPRVPVIKATATSAALTAGTEFLKEKWAIKTQVQMERPMHWETIKLIRNPKPNFMAVKKTAIMVSKRKV